MLKFEHGFFLKKFANAIDKRRSYVYNIARIRIILILETEEVH